MGAGSQRQSRSDPSAARGLQQRGRSVGLENASFPCYPLLDDAACRAESRAGRAGTGLCSSAATSSPGPGSSPPLPARLCSGGIRSFPRSWNFAGSPSLPLPAGFLLQTPRVSCSQLAKGRDSRPRGLTSQALPPGRRRRRRRVGSIPPALAGFHVRFRTDIIILTGRE